MSKTKIYEKIELTIIALCIIFVISIISYNKEIPMLTSANYEKTIGWGIKRENNHLQPDVGSKNKQILEENNGICMGRDGEKIIYLTFDSGYEAGYMDKILTTLKENNVKATFFITAHYLNSATEEVEKMVNDGHIIGNHTVNHKSMPSINNETIEKEIMQLHQSMYEKFGYEMKYLRPPKGEFNERTLQKTSSLGYKTVMWSFAYCDWDEKKQPNLEESRKIITLDEMSPYLPKAYIAIEDERFYQHHGVDLKRTTAAILSFVTHFGKSTTGGGSTITQQLVKNITQDKESSGINGILRKVKEWAKAYQVENELSKNQILELYLNLILVGGRNYGVQTGAEYRCIKFKYCTMCIFSRNK